MRTKRNIGRPVAPPIPLIPLHCYPYPFCCEICEICEALTARGRDKLLMCPCRTIAYCSKECQVKNWKKHKDECQGALNEKGESEAIVKERKITGKRGGKKGKKGKRGQEMKRQKCMNDTQDNNQREGEERANNLSASL